MQQTRDLVVATGLADEIAFRLQAAILDGEFPPGTHLQQDELCARFGVSRTPVREALRKLQAQHLVDLVPNKGATVRTPSRDELSDVYVLRAELEGFAAELAAPRFGPAELAALDAAQSAMDKAIAQLEAHAVTPDTEGSFNRRITLANEEFHGIIHEAAGNQRLRHYLTELQNFFPKDYLWRATSSDESRNVGIEEHRQIRDALQAHDGPAARRTMSEHVAHSGRLLLAYLDRHHFWQ
ncbi:MAG TPA: GntR family transcriptional regulator [Solirubrobacter sp.]|nr:GntR family transcriptional regulator [Solirubrobacter sp.]